MASWESARDCRTTGPAARMHVRQSLLKIAAASSLVAVMLSVPAGSATAAHRASAQVGDAVATVKARVAAWEKPTRVFTAPGPAFSAAAARGKSLWFITFVGIPFVQRSIDGLDAAAAAAGVKVTVFDTKGEVSTTSRGIEQAIASHAGVVIVGNGDPKLYSADYAKAKAAGVKIITLETHDPRLPLPSEPKAIVAEASQCHSCAGRAMADFTIADSGGHANAVVFWPSDALGVSVPAVNAIKAEMHLYCPGCHLKLYDVPSSQWATGLGPATSAVVKDPSVNYLLPLFDGMVPFMLPAVHGANAQGRVKIVSFNASQAVLKSIAAKDVVAADVGTNGERFGWAIADQAFRALSGVAPVPDIKLPMRLFDSHNIGAINLNAAEATWYGSSDYKAAYLRLWRLRK